MRLIGLPATPVIVVHLEDPPGSGLAACCGVPFEPAKGYEKTPRWLCTGCSRGAREGVEVDADR